MGVGLCAIALFLSHTALAANGPTAQGAHNFFQLLADKHLLRGSKDRYIQNYKAQGECISIWEDIDGKNDGEIRHIEVDWSSITSALNMKGAGGDYGDSVTFFGSVIFETTERKEHRNGFRLYAVDGVTRDRIYKAGEFLRTQCDTLSATGF
ncbi:MAG: hypothetical protein COA47_08735 [Robiginitomaculum sp.]|nr:MAG: hypothetical protein COA47_08735 [Robiginitomaculum sp.]